MYITRLLVLGILFAVLSGLALQSYTRGQPQVLVFVSLLPLSFIVGALLAVLPPEGG